MKSDELTPAALLKFFSELESAGNDEECELHYGCGCVISKGLKAAQMLVEVQKALGVTDAPPAAPGGQAGAPARARSDEEAQLEDFEAALMAPGFPRAQAPAQPDPETAARLTEAEGEIDRLLVQNVDLKSENRKLRDKVRDLYKQIERLYTRSEMSKLLGTLDEKIAKEARAGIEAAEESEGPAPEAEDGSGETPAAEDEMAAAETGAGEDGESGGEAEEAPSADEPGEASAGEPSGAGTEKS